MTSEPTELLWVKGSGGDLGTLTESGLAALRLDRLRGPRRRLPRASSARTRWSPRSTTACTARAAPHRRSTPPCTAWSTPPHIDHLHPDSGIALATAADGEALTKECFGDRVAWVDWRRPGFQLGLDIAEVKRTNPQAIGVILGGHGITAWGDTSEECERNSLDIIRTAEPFLAAHGRPSPSAPSSPASSRCPSRSGMHAPPRSPR